MSFTAKVLGQTDLRRLRGRRTGRARKSQSPPEDLRGKHIIQSLPLPAASRAMEAYLHRDWLVAVRVPTLVSAGRGTLQSEFVSGSCRLRVNAVS